MDPLQFDQETMNRIQRARAAGVPDQQVMAEASEYQARKAQTAMPSQRGNGFVSLNNQPQQQQKPNQLLELLPLIGGIAGSFTPAGPIIGGGGGAALGTLLKQMLGGKEADLGEIGKEAALGGVGGVIGKGFGFLGGKLLPKLGGAVAEAGEQAGMRALRLNPSQLGKFVSRHGEDVSQFLTKEGAIGKNAAKIATDHIEPLQQKFNSIAKLSGIKGSPDKFLKNIDDVANELIEAGGSENAALAEKIRQEGLYLMEKSLGPKGFDIAEIDKLRRTFASRVNWNNPEKAVMDHSLADALRKTSIDTAADAGFPELGEIGIKLSKFRDIENAAIRQEQLGRGSKPAGIMKWLAGSVGYGAGGPMGAAAGAAAEGAINSPAVLRRLAQAGMGAGKAMQSIGGIPGGQLTANITGQGIAQSLDGFGQEQMQPGTGDGGIPQPMQDVQGAQAQAFNSPDQLRQIIGTIMLQNAKNVGDIAKAYEFLSAPAAPVKKTEGQVARDEMAFLVDDALGQITSNQGIATGPIAPKIEEFKSMFNAGDESTIGFNRTVGSLKAAIAKARAGTSFTPNEEKLLDQYAPKVGDSRQQILSKLVQLKKIVASRQNVEVVPDYAGIPAPLGM